MLFAFINNNFELEASLLQYTQQLFIDPLAIQWPHLIPWPFITPWMVQLTPGGQYRPLWEPQIIT